MRVASLVSGGKDSICAAYAAHSWGWEIASFLTLLPEADAPMLFHRPNAQWVRLQAEAVGVPWRTEPIEAAGDEERALDRILSGLDVEGVTSGALASEYQRTRFERAAHRHGLKTFTPLWHHDPLRHLQDLWKAGIRSRIVHVAAEGLDQAWLGRALDLEAAKALEALAAKTRLNPAGEGGEYETFVVDAPFFRRRIEIERSRVEWKRDAGTLVIRNARLATTRRGNQPRPEAGT